MKYNYSQLQQLLKAFRLDGYDVQVKLNAKKEILQAEVNRLNEVEKLGNSPDDTEVESSYTGETNKEEEKEMDKRMENRCYLDSAPSRYPIYEGEIKIVLDKVLNRGYITKNHKEILRRIYGEEVGEILDNAKVQ